MFKKVEVPRMPLEDIIQKILSFRSDMTREELQKMIEAKVEEAKGFLTQESAARAVAVELGVEQLKIPSTRRITVKDLVSGLGDVTISARAIYVGPLQKISNQDEKEVKLRHLVIADKTGELRVVIWDNKADLADSLSLLGQVAQFSHGYVRTGYNGRLELSIGSKGSIEVAPSDMSRDDFPLLTEFHKKIGELTKDAKKVNVIGSVAGVHPASSFSREDSKEGMLKKLELQDETGIVTIVFWNSKVQESADIKSGSLLQVFGAKVKESLNGGVELHVDSSVGFVLLKELPGGYENFSSNPTKIRDLKPGLKVTVEGNVVTQPVIREVTTSQNEKINLASFELDDETGRIKVLLWRDFVVLAENLEVNKKIRIKCIYVDYGSFDKLILSSNSGTGLDRI
jgi:replication factor A1